MNVANPRSYTRAAARETFTLPIGRGNEVSYPFQWLLYRPQAHAIEPFQINRPARDVNTGRGTQAGALPGLVGAPDLASFF